MYSTLSKLNWSEIEKDILHFWEERGIFEKSVAQRHTHNAFTFLKDLPQPMDCPVFTMLWQGP